MIIPRDLVVDASGSVKFAPLQLKMRCLCGSANFALPLDAMLGLHLVQTLHCSRDACYMLYR